MRAHLYCIPLALIATLIGEFGVSAQDWQTVDDFALAGGDAEARGVAVDAAGRVYVVGTASGHAIVRYSADGGTTWSTRDDYVHAPETNHPSDTNNLFNAITLNQQGDVFVGGAGAAYTSGVEAGHWIVRRSTDQGVSWQTVDDFYQRMIDPGHPGTNGVVYSLSSDRQGRVFGTGLLLPTGPSYLHWWVRGSGIGGTNWDTRLVIFSGYAGVSQLTWGGEDVYVTGSVSDSDLTSGLILRSSDYGASWTTNFAGVQDFHVAITHDSAANLYSAGFSRSSNSVDWLVRKAPPGGTNWTILDRLTYEGDSSGSGIDQANPRSIAIDPAGNMCVAGQFLDYYLTNGHGGATWTWFTRQFSVATRQWSTTDLFSYSTNGQGVANGTAIAANGTTFVVGYGTTESGQHRWVVRKRAAARPRLQIANVGGNVSVSWSGTDTNSILEWTDSSGTNQLWQTVTDPVSKAADGQNTVNLELTPGSRFFRLKETVGN
jgi:hypothetical protein